MPFPKLQANKKIHAKPIEWEQHAPRKQRYGRMINNSRKQEERKHVSVKYVTVPFQQRGGPTPMVLFPCLPKAFS
jgi:hypothetical protein